MVDTSAAIRRGHPISFIIFTFVAFIVAVIASTLVADYNQNNNAPTKGIENATRFLLFAGWWGFIVGAAYTGLFLASVGGVITSIAGHAISLGLTWIFWLAGAAALTDRTGGVTNCAAKGYPFPYCNSTKALTAFAWIGWIILTFMFAMVIFVGAGAFRGGRSVKESLA
ncbi:uncharacterized protein UBRO_04325 [Ustilago bromivora]|uniref:MARVEL domain-containing protein n=1 Tax=Ustilago bromivora TaxID=307758 RepID=A0A1K0GPV7_9BASI|nr:uncharacterized protein UBRO_04325 [Ustilago bromivora]SYW77116.1 uncharacterized protein UBRO2_01739 [Ustilago bromivora]